MAEPKADPQLIDAIREFHARLTNSQVQLSPEAASVLRENMADLYEDGRSVSIQSMPALDGLVDQWRERSKALREPSGRSNWGSDIYRECADALAAVLASERQK